MNVLIVNQYAPPDPSPTAGLASDLARALKEHGHRVRFASAGTNYQNRRHRGAHRWLQELLSLKRLAWAALARPCPDVIICFSSPPCVLVVAALAALRHRSRLLHWVMDLYPEIAVELGEIPSLANALLAPLMNAAYARCERIVALDSDMAQRLASRGFTSDVLPPWYPEGLPEIPRSDNQNLPDSQQHRVWLYSGNLGRAHEWKTLLEAQATLERTNSRPLWQLVFQGGGPQFEAAQSAAQAMGLTQVAFRGYAAKDQLVAALLAADVLIATQNPATQGCLWPSKLALACRMPRPILWVGPTSSDVARMLRASPANGVFAPGSGGQITDWLSKLPAKPSVAKPEIAYPDPMHAALQQWLEWVEHPQNPQNKRSHGAVTRQTDKPSAGGRFRPGAK